MDFEVCSIDRNRCNLDLYLCILSVSILHVIILGGSSATLIFPVQCTLGYKIIIPVFLGQ